MEDTGLANVELRVPLAEATEKGSEFDEVSVLAHVTVGYDPALTNPIVIRDELGRNGFSVVSAAEEPD